MSNIEELVNLAAPIQCLVVGFSEYYDDCVQLPILDPWVIIENKWRATRYGLDAEIIIDERKNHQALRSNIIESIDILIPVEEELGCKDELVKLGDLAENNHASYQRQILQFQKNNDYTDIVKNSIIEFEKGIAIEC